MNFTSLFINRPVAASIINALIVIMGLMSFEHLTFREYPDIELPFITVDAYYPNASAETVETEITNRLEDALSKIEGLDTLASNTSFEKTSLRLNFKAGTSIDRCMVLIRDALAQVKNDLPEKVQEPEVARSTEQENGPPFMALLVSSNTLDFSQLNHYAETSVKNVFRSLPGVGGIQVWGKPYVMSVKLDAKKMHALGIDVSDITRAFEANNVSLPGGKFRDEVPVSIDLNLKTPEDFEMLLIKENKERPILLKHIAEIKLTTDERSFRIRSEGKKGALILSINPSSDANPLDVSDLVQKELAKVKKTLPDNIQVDLELDQAEFIRASLGSVEKSILEAVVLVLAIIFLFLRNMRATLIPIITIPISVIGTLILLNMFGFSLNTLTLLAIVLAIGLVVDDAIVVLENIHRHIEDGKTPLQASLIGSKEIGFAIIAMTLTLASVYVPIAFMEGFLGRLLSEFAVALSGAVLVSGIVALTLTPMMCSRLIKSHDHTILPQVDVYLTKLIEGYKRALIFMQGHGKILASLAGVILIANVFLYRALPSETAPKEDRGIVGIWMPPIPGKNLDALDDAARKIEGILSDIQEKSKTLVFMGEWGGSVVLPLKPHSERSRSADAIKNEIQGRMFGFPSQDVWAWSVDSGLPNLGNDDATAPLAVAIKTVDTYPKLSGEMFAFRNIVDGEKFFKDVYHDLRLNNPGYRIDIDKLIMAQTKITPAQISAAVATHFSGNRFYKFQKDNIQYKIELTSDLNPWDLSSIYVKSPRGDEVSLAALAKLTPTATPKSLKHYSQMRTAILNVNMPEGMAISTGMDKLKTLFENHLPKHLKTEWIGEAKVQEESSSQMSMLLLMGLIFIYAVLAIQFESFKDPLIILMSVPLASVGALLFLYVFGQSLNIYTQVGLLTLIGLITKHGILIVEFANKLKEEGMDVTAAIYKSAELRLRPILMTTLAMVIGSMPLVFSFGTGSESRRAVGLVLVGGLCLGTFMTLFMIPYFYRLINLMKVKDVMGVTAKSLK